MINYRQATGADMADLTRVRIAVTENALTVEQLLAYGITPESIALSFLEDSKGWVAEVEGRTRGFSIADRKTDRFLRCSSSQVMRSVELVVSC